jgi:arylsulfatase A
MVKPAPSEGGFRVPCVIWGPGLLKKPGRVSNEILSSMDLLPTFAAMAGIQVHPTKPIGGHDATALICGEPNAKSPWPNYYFYFGTELHAVREKKYKFRAPNTLYNEDIYRRDQFAAAQMPAALYDLDRDLSEQKSVFKDHPDVQRHLQDLLAGESKTLGDTLKGVHGHENRKPGYSENPVDPKLD